jgi:anti-anti-sigma factor
MRIMDTRTTTDGGIAVIALKGRFDFSAHRTFRDAFKVALDDSAVREIQINLLAVEYIDSSALGTLLMSKDNATGAGKSISLSGVAGVVKQVLDIANFHKLFTIK